VVSGGEEEEEEEDGTWCLCVFWTNWLRCSKVSASFRRFPIGSTVESSEIWE